VLLLDVSSAVIRVCVAGGATFSRYFACAVYQRINPSSRYAFSWLPERWGMELPTTTVAQLVCALAEERWGANQLSEARDSDNFDEWENLLLIVRQVNVDFPGRGDPILLSDYDAGRETLEATWKVLETALQE
jgi:hypothetical protein